MDSNYTTITITKELSQKIRIEAIKKRMRTGAFIEMLLDVYLQNDLKALFDEIDLDMKELGLKKGK